LQDSRCISDRGYTRINAARALNLEFRMAPRIQTVILIALLSPLVGFVGEANAVDSPNAVVDPGFTGSAGAWLSVRDIASAGCTAGGASIVSQGSAGGLCARLDPTYRRRDEPSACIGAISCNEPDYVPTLVQLSQRAIMLPAGTHAEISFDYRLIPATECLCGDGAEAFRVEIRGSQASGVVAALSIVGVPSEPSGWRRARIGFLHPGGPVDIEFRLRTATQGKQSDLYQYSTLIDNVRLVAIEGDCSPSWSCPTPPLDGYCFPALNTPADPVGQPLAVAPAADDPESAWSCDRPCAPACPSDVTGDALVNGADLGALLSAWGSDNAACDLDDDGVVGGGDLGALLSAWGCGS